MKSTSPPVVIDGWLYYYKNNIMHKTDRTAAMDIELYSSDSWNNAFQYRDGWIYFIKGSFGFMGSASIEKVRIDGTGNKTLASARATSSTLPAPSCIFLKRSWAIIH
jgi:hypothetical protein